LVPRCSHLLAELREKAPPVNVSSLPRAASLGRAVMERRKQARSSSSSRLVGWMLSRLDWHGELEERYSAEALLSSSLEVLVSASARCE